MDKSQEKEYQARIDKIITLMREEAETLLPDRNLTLKTRLYHVLTNVDVRITKIMRTMRE